MESSGEDNGEVISTCEVAPVASNEGESHQEDSVLPNMILAEAIRAQARRPNHKHGFPLSLDQMPKKARLNGGGSKGASPTARLTTAAKGVTNVKKCPQEETQNITPTKKGKAASNAKKKGTMECTPTYPGAILGLNASILENPTIGGKLLKGAISRIFYKMVVLASSLARHSRELKDAVMTQQAQANSGAKEGEGKLGCYHGKVGGRASRYFGDGFDFCKRQIYHLHPELDIQGMKIGVDLFEEEKEEEKDGELDNSPAPQ
ncbi:hypothetical protein Acr_11g0010250 [Actinidia rufa]|uniref:Uncharacterized protein n=1 Tax=Actinidia rufa TaxID=165716 RepID=A0A7J0FDC2_9ERIC|nr:hypothetical protein Acr_11g0010100 [Actinidia rufa]GFY96719.1 hypothetical protein Acr_11g0010250 [Actinidia rufa]